MSLASKMCSFTGVINIVITSSSSVVPVGAGQTSISPELLCSCSCAPAGTLWRCAAARTPRAAYGQAIRHSVPLKKGSERNTTAQDTMLHLPFPPAPPFFLFSTSTKFLQDFVLVSAFSIYLPSW